MRWLRLRVLITGGAGFIGSHTAEALLKRGARVAVLDIVSGGELYPQDGVRYFQESVTSPRVAAIVADFRPDYVIHLAAQVSVAASIDDPRTDFEVNVRGTLNLLEACRRLPVRKVVFASSAAVYGEPVRVPIDERHPIQPRSPYAVAKHTGERYLQLYRDLYGLDFTVLRYANVYGPRQSPGNGEGGVVAVFVRRMLAGKPVRIFGDGEQTRDFVYVGDVAKANLLALFHGSGEVFNIGSARQTSIREVARHVAQLVGRPMRLEVLPPKAGEVRHSSLLSKKAEALLDWRPEVPLSEGLRRTVDYYSHR